MTRPTWHLASTPRPASLRVDPATSTLRPDGSTLRNERDVTVSLAANVHAEIARHCMESPDIETGGGLLSEGLALSTRIAIASAGAPGRSFRRGRSEITFDPRELDDDRLVGVWHSHPRGDDRLSLEDLKSCRRMRRGGRRPINRFVALIATPDPRHGWKKPGLAGWVVGGDYHRRAPPDRRARARDGNGDRRGCHVRRRDDVDGPRRRRAGHHRGGPRPHHRMP